MVEIAEKREQERHSRFTTSSASIKPTEKPYTYTGTDKKNAEYPIEVAMDNLFLPVGVICMSLFGFGLLYGIGGTVGIITYGAARLGINRYRAREERKKFSSVIIPK
jgi:hypothetical protein